MKKFLSLFLAMIICISLAACGAQPTDSETNGTEANTAENVEKSTKKEKKELTAEELEAQLSAQELKITSTKYNVQDENYKALYPYMINNYPEWRFLRL